MVPAKEKRPKCVSTSLESVSYHVDDKFFFSVQCQHNHLFMEDNKLTAHKYLWSVYKVPFFWVEYSVFYLGKKSECWCIRLNLCEYYIQILIQFESSKIWFCALLLKLNNNSSFELFRLHSPFAPIQYYCVRLPIDRAEITPQLALLPVFFAGHHFRPLSISGLSVNNMKILIKSRFRFLINFIWVER